MTRVLGLDPGTFSLGYGLVEERAGQAIFVEGGALTAPRNLPLEQRLSSIYSALVAVLARLEPDEVAVEEPFVARNVRSALAIGQALAIALLAAAQRGLPIYRYPPARIKQQVADFGAADKERLQEMVRLQLGLEAAPQPADASDALAVALCHLGQRRLLSLTQGKL